jgi:hypothetical protein
MGWAGGYVVRVAIGMRNAGGAAASIVEFAGRGRRFDGNTDGGPGCAGVDKPQAQYG